MARTVSRPAKPVEVATPPFWKSQFEGRQAALIALGVVIYTHGTLLRGMDVHCQMKKAFGVLIWHRSHRRQPAAAV